jgi:hypothetical protein
MAFGSDPANERFLNEYFEEKDGEFFLRPPKGADALMPISYELYRKLVDAHETEGRIVKAAAIVCMMSGILFGAYRWLVSDDLLQLFLFAGAGVVAALIGGLVVAMHGARRLGRIYIAWAKQRHLTRSVSPSDDDLF